MKQKFNIKSLNGLSDLELLGMLEDSNSEENFEVEEIKEPKRTTKKVRLKKINTR